ncbi:anti-sigma factor antagonist [Actinomadura sp. KC216]|uniref:STAS domain-containing protein n=1 Tax=Actinomadura sp. KC216 TaxID=2530370 RepID=UPI001049FABA|nr:STAS domain-containing protein [Actinomadura sp. KC216]TDB89824.1 anti-sigma factor antagonist [Actinomadura sp. KC216]
MPLTIEHHRCGDLTVAVLAGEVDVGTSAQLRESLTRLVASGARHLILDVRAVTLIDSNGLGVLLALHHHLRDQHGSGTGSVTLTGVNSRVRDVLRVTRLTSVFPIYGTVDVAVHAHYATRA